MQEPAANKAVRIPRPRSRPDPEPETGYQIRCGCKTLITLPIDGGKRRCPGCGGLWKWAVNEGAVFGRRAVG